MEGEGRYKPSSPSLPKELEDGCQNPFHCFLSERGGSLSVCILACISRQPNQSSVIIIYHSHRSSQQSLLKKPGCSCLISVLVSLSSAHSRFVHEYQLLAYFYTDFVFPFSSPHYIFLLVYHILPHIDPSVLLVALPRSNIPGLCITTSRDLSSLHPLCPQTKILAKEYFPNETTYQDLQIYLVLIPVTSMASFTSRTQDFGHQRKTFHTELYIAGSL